MKSIMYHYVREKSEEYPFSRHEEIDNFAKNCRIINRKYSALTVSEGLMIRDENNIILLTFDDGLKDHLKVAELLSKNGLKGTFYIPVQPYIKKDILPVHKAHLICSKVGGDCLILLKETLNGLGYQSNEIIVKEDISKYVEKYNKHDDDSRIKEFKRIVNYYGQINLRVKILNEILMKLGINNNPDDFYLTPNEIKHIHSLGHEIGSHGVSHNLLSRLDSKSQKKEIQTSKDFLEYIIKKKIKSFCYPFGTKDSYSRETINFLKLYNYDNAVSVEYRDINSNDLINNKFEIPRYDCKNFTY